MLPPSDFKFHFVLTFAMIRQRTLVELVEESGVCLPFTEIPSQLVGAGGESVQDVSLSDLDV